MLSKIHDDCLKNVTARVLAWFPADLAWWPSFWLQVTQFQTWPRNHRQTFWVRFMMIAWKMWPLECQQGFLLIWLGDLVFDSKWPSFELDLEIIKTNILSNIHDDCLNNVTARVLTRFSADLARWPSFWPQVTQFRTWPEFNRGKHFEQASSRLGQYYDL